MLTIDLKKFIEKSAGKDMDRTVAIMESASLELILMALLKSYMRRDRVVGRLFEPFGPLSTLSGKIDCAYALRLINKKTREDLTYIRKIRNKFAHNMAPLSFSDSQIHEWCQKLSTFEEYKQTELSARARYKKAIEDIYKRLGEQVVEVLEKAPKRSS